MAQISVPVSIGELFDKITILRIKSERLMDDTKKRNVAYELSALEEVANAAVSESAELEELVVRLQCVNSELWDIEDGKRQAERDKNFDDKFVQLARQVYIKNDARAEIKRKINVLMGSSIVEEKSYFKY